MMISAAPRIALLLLVAYTDPVRASISGFYVDNGHGLTVMNRRLVMSDAHYVENTILDILDLPDRPPRQKRDNALMSKSAVKFLLDIFKRITDENEGRTVWPGRSPHNTDVDAIPITFLDNVEIRQSDWITTFVNRRHHVAEVHHERGTELWFDVSRIDDDLELLLGELRIYQHNKLSKWKKGVRQYAICVYAISENLGDDNYLQPMIVVNTTSEYRGWLEINVTTAFDNWLNASSSNHGFYIDAHSVYRPDHKEKLSEIGLVKAHGDTSFQPFMVGYFKRTKPIRQSRYNRLRREALNRRRIMQSEIVPDPIGKLIEAAKPEKPKTCQVSSLFVSFRDLHWHDWILAPHGYAASFCGGECNFPLKNAINATNHAIVQMLVHLHFPKDTPKPLCAPTKLMPISVLFSHEDSISMKTFVGMTVVHCGCH